MKDLFDGKSKILIVVAIITQIINALMWYGVSRIEKFAGYEFDISGKMGIWPVAFLRFCIFFLLIWHSISYTHCCHFQKYGLLGFH